MLVRQEAEKYLFQFAAKIFNVPTETLSSSTSFEEDLKAKSVQLVQITTYLEDQFDIELPFMEFKRKKTIGAAAEYIAKLCGE